MVKLLAVSREPLNWLKTITGVCLIGVLVTWGVLEVGFRKELLHYVALTVLAFYVLILLFLNTSKNFEITGAVVKRIASLLLIANLAIWTPEGFNLWVQYASSFAAVYVTLFAYDRLKVANKLSHSLVVDKKKPFIYLAAENENDIREAALIRSYVNTFKDRFQEQVVAYKVLTTRDSDGKPVATIDFAWQGKKKGYHLFEVQLKQN